MCNYRQSNILIKSLKRRRAPIHYSILELKLKETLCRDFVSNYDGILVRKRKWSLSDHFSSRGAIERKSKGFLQDTIYQLSHESPYNSHGRNWAMGNRSLCGQSMRSEPSSSPQEKSGATNRNCPRKMERLLNRLVKKMK